MDIQHIEIAGQPFVLMPRKDYDILAELQENAEDIAAYDASMAARDPNEEGFPESFVDDILDASNAGEPLIPIWRKYRGMTQAVLAEKAGVTQAYISDMEAGKKEASLKAIAKVLACNLDDLV